jgi:glycosyltransferase involved in cell wall biosynthesis
MIKIVYIIQSLGNSGGMERVLCSKANFLATSPGYNVTIITQYPLPKDNFFKFLPSVNIESLNLPLPSQGRLKRYIEAYSNRLRFKKKLTIRLNKIRPTVTVSMYGSEYKFLYKLKDGSKKIVEFHYSRNYLSHLIKSIPNLRYRRLRLFFVIWEQYLQRKYAKKYDRVILLTEKDKMLWKNKPNMKVIPNPLSFFSEKKATLKSRQVVAIGRFIAQKGFDKLIKSFSLVLKKHPDWILIMVGEGQDEEYLNSLIGKNKIAKSVFLKPSTKKVYNYLLNSSILAFPSRYEGFGLVLTEAMECGVPCVSFDCECGPSEIIKHNEDGFLVRNGDITGFSEALMKLMGDYNLRKIMGAKAKKNVIRFHPEVIMKKWESLFQNLST